ncbi:M23 family metallopeptidase [Nocardioides sp. Kera G14]|uniref:M23 family metallopeptidase n=1 Tax=Nocardioides sp. Kera G14 TaxID=2884264 RepID=UPI001D0FF944|nr:peptidoglycan DD-metalloendopeptidase family protein [Nocardioides sp. Kera G14]UDY22632.1 M23 family metallopeptidase [Nocardioides sp. Kera G14]
MPRVTATPVRLSALFTLVVVVQWACSSGAARAGGEPDPGGVWPLSPTPSVVHGFDPPSVEWGAGHRGVDLAGSVGQQVHAAVAGTVSFAGSIAGKPVVVVDEGETRTTYEPVVASVAVGDLVAGGAVIGTLAALFSHCSPAACLHWGLIRNSDDVYLDPLTLVGAVEVRLLPLWRELPADSGPAPTSGARVRLLERASQPVGAHVRVQLGGGQRRVPQKLLD